MTLARPAGQGKAVRPTKITTSTKTMTHVPCLLNIFCKSCKRRRKNSLYPAWETADIKRIYSNDPFTVQKDDRSYGQSSTSCCQVCCRYCEDEVICCCLSGFRKMVKQIRELSEGDESNEQHCPRFDSHEIFWPGSEFFKISGRQPPTGVVRICRFHCRELGFVQVHFHLDIYIYIICRESASRFSGGTVLNKLKQRHNKYFKRKKGRNIFSTSLFSESLHSSGV